MIGGCDLRGSVFEECDLTGVVMEGCSLEGGEMSGDGVPVVMQHPHLVQRVAWQPGGRLVATLCGIYMRYTVYVFDVTTGLQACQLFENDPSGGLSWHPRGHQLAVGMLNGTVEVVDATTWDTVRTLPKHTLGVSDVDWGCDGTRIAVGYYYGVVKVFDNGTGAEVRTMILSNGRVSVVWSPCGVRLATWGKPLPTDGVSSEYCVKVVDPASGGVVWTVPSGASGSGSDRPTWSPDGERVAIVSPKGSALGITIVAAGTGAPVAQLGGNDEPRCLSWGGAGGRLACGYHNGEVVVYDVGSGRAVETLAGHTGPVPDVSWEPGGGGRVVSASHDKSVRVWRPGAGRLVQRHRGHGRLVQLRRGREGRYLFAVASSPDGTRFVSGDDGGCVIVWGVSPMVVLGVVRVAAKVIQSLAWSRCGRRIVVGYCVDRRPVLSVVDVATMDVVARLANDAVVQHDRYRSAPLSLHNDGLRAATRGSAGEVDVWDVGAGAVVERLEVPMIRGGDGAGGGAGTGGGGGGAPPAVPAVVRALAYSADGTMLAGYCGTGNYHSFVDKRAVVHVWDVAVGGAPHHTFPAAETAYGSSIAWRPDGARLALAASGRPNGTTEVFDPAVGRVNALGTTPSQFPSVAWRPDGACLAVVATTKTDVVLRSPCGERELHTLRGPREVHCLAFTPDSRRLIAGLEDGS